MATASRNVTDRALRYRANQAIPEHPRVCAFCGIAKGDEVEVGHVDGHEENDSPDNLTWTCRPCNVIAANTLRKAGMGRKTVQFNPTKGGGAANLGEWMNAVGAITPRTDRGDRGLSSTMSVPDAVAMIRATPHSKRSDFARELGKHKSARAAERWNPKTKRNGMLSDIFGSRTTVYDLGKARKETADRQKQSKAEGARLVKEYRAEQKRQDREDARRERQEAKAERERQPKTLGFYKGYRTYKTPDGEYFTSLDRDSWYDTLAQAKRSVDDFQKGRSNPNYEASLLDQARTARAPEELARLYRYAAKHKNGALKQAVENRAENLRIPRSALTKETNWNPKDRRNPESGADKLYESFHGKPPDETIEIHEDSHEHEWLGGLGDLTEIYADTLTGMRLQLTWDGKDTPFLAFTEDGKQAYIKGGNQKLDLKSIKMDGAEWVKDRMVIGQFSEPDPCSKCGGRFKYSEKRNLHVCQECRHVADDNDRVHNLTYRTEKEFDGFQQVDYQHDLGEVTEVRPMLEYEPRNERLYVTGGQYHIEMPLFETSPGIEN